MKPARHLKPHHSTMITLGVASSPIITNSINVVKKFNTLRFNQKVAATLRLIRIIHANIPFSVTSNHQFQVLLQYLNDRNQIPRSPTTIKQLILTHFHPIQPRIAKLMQQSTTHIHDSYDGWTSPH